MAKRSERDSEPFCLFFCPPLWAVAHLFCKHCHSVSSAELLTVSRISRAHWSHLELMLLGFNPLWSISEPVLVVIWKSLELRVHFCCIAHVDGWGPCCGETWNELWDPPWVAIPGFYQGWVHSGSSEGPFCRANPLQDSEASAEPQNWTCGICRGPQNEGRWVNLTPCS